MNVVAPPSLSYSYRILKAGKGREINPGDGATLQMSVKNNGSGVAQGVILNLLCENSDIKMEKVSLNLGDISPGSEIKKEIPFSVDSKSKRRRYYIQIKTYSYQIRKGKGICFFCSFSC